MSAPELKALRDRLRAFAREREWEPFHSPKNLSMALSGEAGEVLEHFQWLTEEQSRQLPPETRDEVALELADVLLYLVSLADKLDIDLYETALRKIELNAKKYPVEQARGNARKYTDRGK